MLMSQRWDFLSDGKTSRFGDKAMRFFSIQTQFFYCWGVFFNQIRRVSCFHLCFIYLQKFKTIPHELFYQRFLQHVKQCDVIGFVFTKHLEEFLRTALGITVFEDMKRTLHLCVLMVEGDAAAQCCIRTDNVGYLKSCNIE